MIAVSRQRVDRASASPGKARRHVWGGSPVRVAALATGYALVHSALATRQAKALAEHAFGKRRRNGLYRFFFNAQSIILFAWGAWAFVRLPDRSLYKASAPWSRLPVGLQLAGVGLMGSTALAIGLPRFAGLAAFAELLSGAEPAPGPEAQGPSGNEGGMLVRGPFHLTRHPANWALLPVVLCFPHMTVNRATLAALSVAYLILGSIHEERRLEATYGEAYRRYRQRTPFFLGAVRIGPGRSLVSRRRPPSP